MRKSNEAESAYDETKKAMEKAKNEVHAAYLSYTNDFVNIRKQLLNTIREKMGTDSYDIFIEENKDFLDTYKQTINRLTSGATTDVYTRNLEELTQYYNDLYKRVMAYINQHGYHKSSGF